MTQSEIRAVDVVAHLVHLAEDELVIAVEMFAWLKDGRCIEVSEKSPTLTLDRKRDLSVSDVTRAVRDLIGFPQPALDLLTVELARQGVAVTTAALDRGGMGIGVDDELGKLLGPPRGMTWVDKVSMPIRADD